MNDRTGNLDDIQHLLAMLEKSSDEQRQNLLELIQDSDPSKAALLRTKILTVDRLLHLDEESLSRILEDIPVESIAHSLRGVDIEIRKRTLMLVNGEKKKKILDVIMRVTPTEVEIQVAKRKFIAHVRELEKRGSVHLGYLRKVPVDTKKVS